MCVCVCVCVCVYVCVHVCTCVRVHKCICTFCVLFCMFVYLKLMCILFVVIPYCSVLYRKYIKWCISYRRMYTATALYTHNSMSLKLIGSLISGNYIFDKIKVIQSFINIMLGK